MGLAPRELLDVAENIVQGLLVLGRDADLPMAEVLKSATLAVYVLRDLVPPAEVSRGIRELEAEIKLVTGPWGLA